MNFPKLALSAGALEAGRRVSPRSRCSPALSEVRAMKLKWGKLGKDGRQPFTGFPVSKTNKNLRRARKRSIRNTTPIKSCCTTRLKKCLAVALLVRFNQTLFRQKHGKPSSPKGEHGKPSSPAPKGERSRPRKGKPRHAC
jgi:hypothetical protein